MNLPYLPQELLDIITEPLRGDISALCSCPLISNSWTNPAHHLLFRHFQYARWREVWKLLEFFWSSPRICGHIQVLTPHGKPYHDDVKLDGTLLEGLFAALPSLRELQLQCLDITSHDKGVTSESHTSKKALQVLSIKDVNLHGEALEEQLLSLVQLLRPISSVNSFSSKISDLTVRTITWLMPVRRCPAWVSPLTFG